MQSFEDNRNKLRQLVTNPKNPKNSAGSHEAEFKENIVGISGNVKIELIYDDGTIKTPVDDKNMVVTQAETIMPFMAIGTKQFGYIELGDPATPTAPTLADIALEQTTGQRKSVSNSISGNTLSLVGEWAKAEGNGYSYTESGLFTNPLGAGDMFARKTYNPITKTSDFVFRVTWGITFRVAESSGGCTGVALMGSSTVTSTYLFISTSGGETQVTVPIDFTIGAKSLDVYLNGPRLEYGTQYFETSIGANRGIEFVGFNLIQNDRVYFVKRTIA